MREREREREGEREMGLGVGGRETDTETQRQRTLGENRGGMKQDGGRLRSGRERFRETSHSAA